MERTLPFKPNAEFQTSCWDANWLSIILSDEKYLPWYIEHFISIHMESNYLVRYYDPYEIECCSIYNEVLDIIPIEMFIKDIDDVILFTKNKIDNGYYVNFTLDLFFIDFSNDYTKNHNFHGPLVFGYSDEKKVFYGYDLLFGTREYEYDQYKAGCESLFESIRDKVNKKLDKNHENYNVNKFVFKVYDIGLHTLGYIAGLRNQSFREKPMLGRIFLALERCLEGNIIINEKDTSFNKWFGLSIYDKMNRDIFSNWEQVKEKLSLETQEFIYRGFRTIFENKEGIEFRIKYLFDNNVIPIDYDLLNKCDFLSKELKRAFSLFLKFNEKPDRKYLDSVQNIMSNIEVIDREVLERSSEAVFQAIKHGLLI
jgi:hypothetical protein